MLTRCDNCNRSLETSMHEYVICDNHWIENLYNVRSSVHLCSEKCSKIHNLDYHTSIDIK